LGQLNSFIFAEKAKKKLDGKYYFFDGGILAFFSFLDTMWQQSKWEKSIFFIF